MDLSRIMMMKCIHFFWTYFWFNIVILCCSSLKVTGSNVILRLCMLWISLDWSHKICDMLQFGNAERFVIRLVPKV
ncbi:hypothetical protein QVD17_05125 [Tagetes erecta]|uniref:Uncharacterized protein n=1 Tax=Tagetes erecta TaxID=13708 RepID=A0AAD8PAY5_TARER|nr:hypothetical protein QVD17_05125 [Tagetes erecta]